MPDTSLPVAAAAASDSSVVASTSGSSNVLIRSPRVRFDVEKATATRSSAWHAPQGVAGDTTFVFDDSRHSCPESRPAHLRQFAAFTFTARLATLSRPLSVQAVHFYKSHRCR